ncbi:thioesterase domain-containing protein [Halomicronema hongdechloris]|uniref:thioesterase domain-containing protein n=1 Tax=Halomicronema hongdechloris TaxID=1209493 RepID=UPI0010CBC7DB|nr:hypothetical protein [Halomicronema hongdechloris]
MANLVPADIGNQQLLCFVKVFKSNVRAMSEYIPQVYPSQIFLFRASDGISREFDSQTLGWGELCCGPLEILDIPGDHYTMLHLPHVQVLAERLIYCLGQVK